MDRVPSLLLYVGLPVAAAVGLPLAGVGVTGTVVTVAALVTFGFIIRPGGGKRVDLEDVR